MGLFVLLSVVMQLQYRRLHYSSGLLAINKGGLSPPTGLECLLFKLSHGCETFGKIGLQFYNEW